MRSLDFDMVDEGDVLRAMDFYEAHGWVPNSVMDNATRQLDRRCKLGTHLEVVDGKCVWCCREVTGGHD